MKTWIIALANLFVMTGAYAADLNMIVGETVTITSNKTTTVSCAVGNPADLSDEQLFAMATSKGVGSCRIVVGGGIMTYYIKGHKGPEVPPSKEHGYFDVSDSREEILENLRFYIRGNNC